MPPPEIPQPLASLWDYWIAKRGQREMPERADIDPVEIPALVPHLSLFAVVGDRFQFRIAGRLIVEAYGVEPRGKFLDALLPKGYAEVALRAYKAVLESRRPTLARSDMKTPRGGIFPLTRLLLPLAQGSLVGYVLAGLTIEKLPRFESAPLAKARPQNTFITVL